MDNQLYCGYETRVHCCYSSIIYPFFFLFLFHTLNCCVSVFSGALQARNCKVGILMANEVLYRGMDNWAHCLCFSLKLPISLSFQCKSVTIFSGTIQVRVFHLGINVKKYIVLWERDCGSLLLFFQYLFVFFLSLISHMAKVGRKILRN